MSALLNYNIFEGVLLGTIGRKLIHITAMSGGGAGSKLHKANFTANNPYMTGLKTITSKTGHQHGGPIPPGRYTIMKPGKHPHLGLSAELVPFGKLPLGGRGGFFIHGRGPHGSDGCIVPTHDDQFRELMQELEQSNGGSLIVQEEMSGNRFA